MSLSLSNGMVITILIVAVGIVIGLGWYAFHLLKQLQQQKQRQQVFLEEAVERRQKAVKEARQSIAVLASALHSGQERLTLTEAAIRISVLMQVLPLTEQQQKLFSPFIQLSTDTSHIPYLDDWKALSAVEQARFDKEREDIEFMHKANVMAAVEQLLAEDSPVHLAL